MEFEVENIQETNSETFARQSEVKIFIATDYSKFTLSEFNRDPSHYKKILESIKKKDFTKYAPIIVDNEMIIVDGQNRFLACQELGIPIHFIVSEEICVYDAADINRASKNWNITDFTRHYAKRGRKDYIRLLDLCAKYEQKISVVMAFGKQTGGVNSHSENVKSGNFEFKDEIDIDGFFEHIKVFDEYYDFTKREKFVKAILKIYNHKDYKEDAMINKLRNASGIVHEQPRVDMMTQELLKLYNYNNRKPLTVK